MVEGGNITDWKDHREVKDIEVTAETFVVTIPNATRRGRGCDFSASICHCSVVYLPPLAATSPESLWFFFNVITHPVCASNSF